MALRNPPSWQQQGSHSAENDRLSAQGVISSTGVIGSGSMAVSANSTPAMNVNVAAGWAAIVGSYQSNMGIYQAYNDAVTNLTITAADTTYARVDRVVVTINDAYYSGLTNSVTLSVLAGTPAGSPSAPAIPTNAISLATIAVAANATTITNANITDTRVYSYSNLLQPVAAGTSTVPVMQLTSGTTLTTANGGAMEYEGRALYFTPNSAATSTISGGRGLVQTNHFYALNSDRTLTTTAGEATFGVRLSAAANIAYELDAVLHVSFAAASGTASFSVGVGGTSTLGTGSNWGINYRAPQTGTSTAGSLSSINSTSFNTYYSIGSSSAPGVPGYSTIYIKGIVRTTATGSIGINSTIAGSGQYGTLFAGSFMKLTPIGSNTAVSVGAWA